MDQDVEIIRTNPQIRQTPVLSHVPAGLVQRTCGGLTERTMDRNRTGLCKKQSSFGANPLSIQPKLTISLPDDPYEREADRVAGQVMRIPEPAVQRKSSCPLTRGKTCDDENERDSGVRVQRKVSAQSPQYADVPPSVHDVLQSPGQPLDQATRAFFKPRFGHDFSDVQVHTDSRAAESAKAVDALAYTVGKDIVFGEGQYTTVTRSGSALLSHELSHVLQQNGGAPRFNLQNTPWARPLQRHAAPPASNHLQSPRFIPSDKLERCYEDKDRLREGDPDVDAVTRVQQALVDVQGITGNYYDLGSYGPNRDGVDGKYGPKTAAAVKKFKADEGLGSKQFGDVGPGVMHRLDQLFPPTSTSVPPGSVPPCPVLQDRSIKWPCYNKPEPSYPPRCLFTEPEKGQVNNLLTEARIRAVLAYMNIRQRHPHDLLIAKRTFGESDQNRVTFDLLLENVGKIIEKVGSLHLDKNLVRGTCDEPQCRPEHREHPGVYLDAVAVTLEPELTTIAVCPFYFNEGIPPHQKVVTLLHEAAHMAKIDPAENPDERYCSGDNRPIICRDVCPDRPEEDNWIRNVDAWARLIHCLSYLK